MIFNKKALIIVLIVFNLQGFSQKVEIQNFINQLAIHEAPTNFKFYYLNHKSIKFPTDNQLLSKIQLYNLKQTSPNFPLELLNKNETEIINWENYNLSKVRFSINNTRPQKFRLVKFIKYNIKDSVYKNLINSKAPYTLLVKKEDFGVKKRFGMQ